jgi:hypothetical protein
MYQMKQVYVERYVNGTCPYLSPHPDMVEPPPCSLMQ